MPTRRGIVLCLQPCEHIMADVDETLSLTMIVTCRQRASWHECVAYWIPGLLHVGSTPRNNMGVHVVME